MPIAYSYDADTKIYNGEIERQLDPLESEKAGYEIWLMPANSTDVPPLEPMEGYNIVWEDGFWSYIEIPQPPAPPEPEPPTPPTEEEQRRKRELAYEEEVDPITCHIQRLRDEEQTPEILAEIQQLQAERSAKIEEIKERYPYPVDEDE